MYCGNNPECGSSHVGPHAVCGSRPAGSTGPMENTYHYDLNGNNLSGAGRSIAYTVFSKPYQIQSAQGSTHFWYDSERNRFKRKDVGERYEYYIGNVEVLKENGRTIYRRNVGSTILRFDPLVDLDVQHSQRSQVITDHLGSTVAVHTPDPLVPWQYQSFEPFGNKLHQSAPSQMIGLIAHWTDRGFTGHEGVDKAGIIHMNGRIYDPVMGRFLQADPFIQEPDNTQSLNRYSYVINNPLSYTDPSGYFFNSVFSAVFQGIVVAAGCSVGSFIGCGVAGFVSNIALGQTLRQSVINGAVSGLQAVALDKVGALAKAGDINSYAAFAIHGVIGAASAAAQGGDPLSAFLSSSLSKVFSLTAQGILESVENSAIEAVVVGVIGGTVSELTGGGFANGAVTAAFGYVIQKNQSSESRSSDASSYTSSLPGAPISEEQMKSAIALFSDLARVATEIAGETGNPVDTEIAEIASRLSNNRIRFDDDLTDVIAKYTKSDGIAIGPAFFDPNLEINPAGLSNSDGMYLNSSALRFRQLFVLRHEIAHGTYSGIRYASQCFPECADIGGSKGAMPWEDRPQEKFANRTAYSWLRQYYEKI